METIDLQGSLPLNLWSYALLNFECWLGIVICRPREAKGKPHPEDDRMRVTCFHNLLWLDDRHGPIYLFGATGIIRYVRGSGLRQQRCWKSNAQAGCGSRTVGTRLHEMAAQPCRSKESKRRRCIMRRRWITTFVGPIEPSPIVGFAARQARPPRPELGGLTLQAINAAETPLPRPARHPTSSAGPLPDSCQAATNEGGNRHRGIR